MGIRMKWRLHEIDSRTNLEDPSAVQDDDLIRVGLGNGCVVGNQQYADAKMLFDRNQKVENLKLQGRIKCARWLIGDDKLR